MNKAVKESFDLAVYGSLKKGFGNHGLLRTSEYIGTGFTEPKFSMYSLGSFPGLYTGNDKVLVEIYRVDTDYSLPRLDSLEGHPDWYRRTLETVTLTNGIKVEAWLYTFCHDPSFMVDNKAIIKPSIVTWDRGNSYDFD